MSKIQDNLKLRFKLACEKAIKQEELNKLLNLHVFDHVKRRAAAYLTDRLFSLFFQSDNLVFA